MYVTVRIAGERLIISVSLYFVRLLSIGTYIVDNIRDTTRLAKRQNHAQQKIKTVCFSLFLQKKM